MAERYGWTLDQIDDQPHERVERMLEVALIKQEVETERAKRAASSA